MMNNNEELSRINADLATQQVGECIHVRLHGTTGYRANIVLNCIGVALE